MALIKTFQHLSNFVKFIASSDPATAMIDTTAAEQRYLLPVLTARVYNVLNDQVAAGNVDTNKRDLLALARAVAAPMAVYHNLALTQVKITDTGIKKTLSEDFEAAHKWEYNEVREQLLDQACLALEGLINYLVTNGNKLGWNNPAYSGSLFKTGLEFSEVFPLHQPHRTFMSLRPLIREAEREYLQVAIGSAFLKELKEITEIDEDEDEGVRPLELAKKFVANYVINKAIEKLSIAITDQGFTVLILADADKPMSGRSNAPDNQLSLLHRSTKADAKLYLSKLKSLLNSKASATVYKTYFESALYSGNTTIESRNSNRRGIFGL